jgi:Beta protein
VKCGSASGDAATSGPPIGCPSDGSVGVPDTLYVPVLKGRQGEFAALAAIQPVTRRHILPLVEIVPGPADERGAIRSFVNKTVMKLRPWAGSRLLLDAGLLPIDLQLHDGVGAVAYSVITALNNGLSATPVVRLSDEPLALTDAAQVHADCGGGVAIRLSVEDMDEDSEDIDEALSEALRRLKVDRPEADLVLDVGAVNGDLAVRAGSRLVTDLLRDITDIDEWRGVIVTAGAFPVDLSSVQRWVIGELPRYDAALWDHLQGRRRITRTPTYGDYAVAHPVLATGAAFPAAPQLRYTVADRWLALKGGRNDPRGHEQFYDVCEVIAAHPEFAGAALGKADARIANARANGRPGNAATWREIGTAHHLDYVVRRLTTLGEP